MFVLALFLNPPKYTRSGQSGQMAEKTTLDRPPLTEQEIEKIATLACKKSITSEEREYLESMGIEHDGPIKGS